MRRSRSGTPRPVDKPGLPTILLIIALAVVLAFAGSLIFGLRGTHEREPSPGDTVGSKPPSAIVHDTRARVEVLNGGGKSGLAKLATEQLRDAGFDVVQFGNTSATAKSYVLDRVGKLGLARDAAHAIGIADARTAIDTTRYVDATVVLGKDWPLRENVAASTQHKSWIARLLHR